MIYASSSTTVTVTNSSTETALFTQAVPISLLSIGRVLRMDFWGTYSAVSLATITMRLRYGASVTSSTVLATAATSSLALATNSGFNAITNSTVRATGSSGSIFTQGKLEYALTGNAQNAAWIAATAAVPVDLSADATLFATIQFGGANVSNVVITTNGTLMIE